MNRGTSILDAHARARPHGPSTGITDGLPLERGLHGGHMRPWKHDVPRGGRAIRVLTAPEAMQDGQRLVGRSQHDETIDAPTDTIGAGSTYAPVDASTGNPRRECDKPGQLLNAKHSRGTRWSSCLARRRRCYAGMGSSRARPTRSPTPPLAHWRRVSGSSRLRGPRLACAADRRTAYVRHRPGRLPDSAPFCGKPWSPWVVCEEEEGRLAFDGILAVAAGARTD